MVMCAGRLPRITGSGMQRCGTAEPANYTHTLLLLPGPHGRTTKMLQRRECVACELHLHRKLLSLDIQIANILCLLYISFLVNWCIIKALCQNLFFPPLEVCNHTDGADFKVGCSLKIEVRERARWSILSPSWRRQLLLWNVGQYTPACTVLHPRRQPSSVIKELVAAMV
jgi:hypothetical protein